MSKAQKSKSMKQVLLDAQHLLRTFEKMQIDLIAQAEWIDPERDNSIIRFQLGLIRDNLADLDRVLAQGEIAEDLHEELAKAITSDLFVNGAGETADRLVMVKDQVFGEKRIPEKNLGGWCSQAVIDRVRDAMRKSMEKASPLKNSR